MKKHFLSPDWNFVESSMLGPEDKEGRLIQRQFDCAGGEKIISVHCSIQYVVSNVLRVMYPMFLITIEA